VWAGEMSGCTTVFPFLFLPQRLKRKTRSRRLFWASGFQYCIFSLGKVQKSEDMVCMHGKWCWVLGRAAWHGEGVSKNRYLLVYLYLSL
jgi:hypothetical protein